MSLARLFAVVCLIVAGTVPVAAPPSSCDEWALKHNTPGVFGGFPPNNNSTSRELVYQRVKGVRYAIPHHYFMFPPLGCDREVDGFELLALWPDMLPRRREQRARATERSAAAEAIAS